MWKLSEKTLIEKLIQCLVLLIPLHFYICEILLKNFSLDNIIRDIVIIVIFVIMLCKEKINIDIIGIMILISDIIMVCYALSSIVMNNYEGTFNILRTYLVPSLCYFIFRNIELSQDYIRKVLKQFIGLMAIIGVYGLFQAFVLGDQFLIAIGYPTADGTNLASSYYINGFLGHQRSVGTFVSANTFGVIMIFAVFCALCCDVVRKVENRVIVVLILLVGMAATISRSSILGMLIALIYYFFISIKMKPKLLKALLTCFVVGGSAVVLADMLVLDGLFMNMLFSGLANALQFSDLSSKKHFEDLIVPMALLVENPMGLGFGRIGPMSLGETSMNIESSIYTIAYEVGMVPAIIYFLPYLEAIVTPVFNASKKKKIVGGCILAVFMTYLFLPNVQCFEILFFVYSAMGLSRNPRIEMTRE